VFVFVFVLRGGGRGRGRDGRRWMDGRGEEMRWGKKEDMFRGRRHGDMNSKLYIRASRAVSAVEVG
jgi:hypothetical protein